MITLYGFGRVFRQVIGETRDLRAQWALEEAGLPYRVHGVDHTGGENQSAAYVRMNCFRLLPVIDDDGFVVAESGAVLLYIAEKAGRPMVLRRARNLRAAADGDPVDRQIWRRRRC